MSTAKVSAVAVKKYAAAVVGCFFGRNILVKSLLFF